jgi:Na+/proline symporter
MAAHFQVRERNTRGVVLGPVVGALSASLAWMLLTWAGVGIDTPWPWLAAFIVPAVITYPLLLVLARVRVAHDARERARLKIG